MVNPSPYELLKLFYPDGSPRGRFAVYTTTLRGGEEHGHWLYNLREVDRLTAKYRSTRQASFSLALHDPDRALAIAQERRRRSRLGIIRGCEGSTTALAALWAEIACAGGAARGGATRLPPTRQQGMDLLDAVSMRPSIVIRAGNKFWVFWRLRRPFLFDPENPKDPQRADAKALLVRLHWAIESRAMESGWHFDAAGDAAGDVLAAAFPFPGFAIGRKAKGPRAAAERLPLVSGDDRYRRADFESLPEPPPEENRAWDGFVPRPMILVPPRPPHDLRPIAAGCTWICYCRSHRAMLDKSQWKNAVRLLSECALPGVEPRQLVHGVSEGHPGYSPFDTDDELSRALQDPRGSITCREIGKQPGVADRHCSRCPNQGRIKRPVDLAVEAAARAAETSDTVEPSPPDPPKSPAELPAVAPPPQAVPPATAPGSVVTAASAPRDDELLAGLEEVLLACGGAATARQVLRALDTGGERFAAFSAAFRGLFPHLEPNDRKAAVELGYRLRALKGRVQGGRILVETRRTRDGVTWTVQRVQPVGGSSP